MTSEEKELIIKDLCTRLPYGIMVHWAGEHKLVRLYEIKLYGHDPDNYIINGLGQPEPGYEFDMRIKDIKPYLRPMSSMTAKEYVEYEKRVKCILDIERTLHWCDTVESIDYLVSHHLDYKGFIKKGWALPAPESMYSIDT